MTFLPIVGRELRVASRRRGTYWGRFAAASMAVLAGGWVLVVTALDSGSQKDAGPVLFAILAAMMFVWIAIAGIQLTSDCLSTEKSGGTLGLLFLTDLRGYDVVFGKLAATSMAASCIILAVLPVLAISLLLGGVSNAEFWRVALVAANLLFFFLSTGIFASSVSRDDQRALGVAVALALALNLTPVLMALYLEQHHSGSNSPLIWLICPAYGCVAAFADGYKWSPGAFWVNVAITQFYAWAFLWLACRIVPRSWQE
ncbi:MAG: ABC transporter permease, partial [Bryobacteraceae bacterium]